MMKALAARLAILALSTVIALLGVELYVRLYVNRTLDHFAWIQQPDELLNHSLIPNSYGTSLSGEFRVQEFTNSIGLRDREYPIPKSPEVYRILILGDSFVYGWGLDFEESFPKQLEKLFSQHASRSRVEVINAGVPSYSPTLSFLQLKHRLGSLDPDLVIYAFDLSDVNDEVKYAKLSISDEEGRLLRVRSQFFSSGLLNRLLRRLHSYQYLIHILSKKMSPYIENDEEFDHWIGARDGTSQKAPNGWSLVKRRLVEMRDYSLEKNADFILVAIPRSFHLSTELVNYEDLKKYNFPLSGACCLELFSILEEFSVNNDITYINPYSSFKEFRPKDELYFKSDGHFSVMGSRLFADVIFQYLTESDTSDFP